VSYELIIRPEAEADMAGAFAWYEERREGLGREFLNEERAVFLQIEDNPLRRSEIYKQARRALVRRFPYKVIYLFEAERVEVLAVVYAGRDPQFWQRRVR
jgi:plasmid stabilization system protein ParE